MIVPLTAVKITGELEGGHATMRVFLNYTNVSKISPIETTFHFPLDKTTVITKMKATF